MTTPLFPDTFDAHPLARRRASNLVIVSTDGSCLKNPGGASGWAWYSDDNCWGAGGLAVGTNQQAELMAALEALRSVPLHLPLLLVMDSKYTLQSCSTWIRSWKAKGWRKADGQPVMNLELMKALDAAITARTAPVTYKWVKGHQGDIMNENADYRCGEAAHAVAKRLPVNEGPGWGEGPTGVQTAPPAQPKVAKPVRRRR